MAGDILIRFTGDASGLASFYQGVARQTDAFVSRLTKTYRSQFQDILKTQEFIKPNGFDSKGNQLFARYGTSVRGVKLELDQLNDVLKITGESGLRLSNGTFLPVAQTNAFRGSVSALTEVLQKEAVQIARNEQVANRYSRTAGRIAQQRDAALGIAAPLGATRDSAAVSLAQSRAARTAITDELAARRKFEAGLARPLTGVARTSFDTRTNALLTQRASLQKEVERATRSLTKAQEAYDKALADPRIANYDARMAKLQANITARSAQQQAALSALQAEEAAVFASPATKFPKGYQRLPPQLTKQLTKGGLSTSITGLYDQEAKFNAPTKDLVRGVTELSGSFKDSQGVINRWAAEIDKNGRLVTRFGGQLSGIDKIASQISRNFQKVIEWTVATTVVFGGLAAAVSGLDVIKNLDANLTRFGITANLTATQTKSFFDDIAAVAQRTATPLEDMVKAADDIALAVKKPGQTVQQLTHDVLALSEAVGIFTNLTGQDTVTATNQLVAVMKQLGLEASGVVGILDKITAVAGGQSQAISDITQGLSVMAEAGKQANLTVDQQIATIQVLAQVTSKSPAEIATAFKNLVGAIQNPAGVKALEKYGIALHDLRTGELRNLIDIYTEIQQKISSGVIPTGQISKLIRDISGGPRRAPDAAALLANIGAVNKTTATSVNATNEALIANSQVLDTLQAKFVQFQNVLKSTTFKQFGQAFKEAATTVISAATVILQIIGKIPAGLISLGLQAVIAAGAFGLLFKTLRGIGTVLGPLGGIFGRVVAEETALGAAATQTAVLYDAAGQKIIRSATQQELATGRLAKTRGLIGRFSGAALGGILGAGIGAATSGGNTGQIAGAGLQGLGVGLLAIPEPTLLTKLAGGAALLAGTFLSLQTATKDLTEDNRAHAQSVLQVYDSYRQAGGTLKDALNDRADLAKQIERLNEEIANPKTSTKDREAAVQRLSDLHKQLADNMATVISSSADLNQSLTQLSAVDPGLARMAEEARVAGNNTQKLVEYVQQLQKTVLSRDFPGLQVPGAATLPTYQYVGSTPDNNGTKAVVSERVQKTGSRYNIPGSYEIKQTNVDLNDLSTNLKLVTTLFDESGRTLRAAFDPSSTNIAKVETAISNLPPEMEDFKNAALETVRVYANQNNALSQGLDLVRAYTAVLDNKQPFISPEEYDRSLKFLKLLDGINKAFGGGVINKDQYQSLIGQGSAAFAQAQEQNKAPDDTAFKDIAQGLAEASKLTTQVEVGTDGWKDKLNQLVETLTGIPDLFGATKNSVKEITPEIQELLDGIDKVKASLLEGLAGDSLKAFADFKGGVINSKEFAKTNGEIQAQRELVITLGDALHNAAADGGQAFTTALQEMSKGLEKIPGLEDATSLQADQLVSRLLSVAQTMHLTKGQTDKLTTAVGKLIRGAELLSKVKAQFNLSARITNFEQLKAALKAMRLLLTLASNPAAGGAPGAYRPSNTGGLIDSIDAALSEISKIGPGADSAVTTIGNILRGGSGSTSGSGSGRKKKRSSGSGPDVSLLDLPDEIANATNRSALIQEAIKRAKALQAKIPGANAEAKNDIVELLKGTQRILEVRGVKDDLLRKALEELADVEKKRLEFESKADTIQRIRVGAGDFAALANVPFNSKTGVSVGGPDGPITVNLNINGQVLTPAQFAALADQIAAAIKRQIGA